MPDLDRVVAGLRCRDVLALLADYIDGELDSESVERVNAHLRACDACERFGGAYGALVAALRAGLAQDPDEPEVAPRLQAWMERHWAGGSV